MIAIRYESLVETPAEVITRLYKHLDEEPFDHNFWQVTFDVADVTAYNEALGMPGLHKIRPRVEASKREIILPPDLFAHCNRSFWDMPGQNHRDIPIR